MGQFDDQLLFARLANEAATEDVRRLILEAVRALGRGEHEAADALLRDVDALEAATLQHRRAIIDARAQVSRLHQTIRSFWEQVADDRSLHELADDASVLMDVWDELERAQSRLILLEMTGP